MVTPLLNGGYFRSIGRTPLLPGVHLVPPLPKRNDLGTISTSIWQVAGAIGVATLNTIASISIANKRYRIAKRYWELAREEWDYFQNNFKPIEKQELLEIQGASKVNPDYINSISVYTTLHQSAFNINSKQLMQVLGNNCLELDAAMIRDIEITNNLVKGDMSNFAWRHTEARAEALDDVRWNRQIAAANRGRNLQSDTTKFSKAAAQGFENQAESLNKATQGATKFLGYLQNRRETNYTDRPTVNARYDEAYTASQDKMHGLGNETGLEQSYSDTGTYTTAVNTVPKFQANDFDNIGSDGNYGN